MAIRIFILVIVTLFSLMMSLGTYYFDDHIPIFWSLMTVGGIVAIHQVVWSHTRYALSGNKIVIKKTFQEARVLELEQLHSWHVHAYNMRGQRIKTILIFLQGKLKPEDKIVLANSSNHEEFEKVLALLKGNYAALQY